jgi:peptidoglycan/xylan/chitin deacetylase (PgdA/CDA1 family)
MGKFFGRAWSSLPVNIRREAFLLACLFVIFLFMQIPTTISHYFAHNPLVKKELNLITISSKEISRGDTTKKQVIFTFDAGSSDVSAEKILGVLAKHHITGTFFMTGKFVEAYPETVSKIVSAGHEVFNHTYDHPHLTEIDDVEIGNELAKMNDVLEKTAHVPAKPFFRPPFGDRDDRVLKAAFGFGYESVYWTVDALDWMEPQVTADEVRSTILSTLAPGNIYLMHVGDTITGDILDDVFTTIEAKGYKIVSLTQGL